MVVIFSPLLLRISRRLLRLNALFFLKVIWSRDLVRVVRW